MRNVLICNSDYDTVEAIGLYLQQEGYEVFRACNGKEALRLIRDETIHLMITDTWLPEENGIALVAKVRESNSLPIIILSDRDSEVDKISALNAGADDYVVRSCSLLELTARVKSQLRRYTQLKNMRDEIRHIYEVDGLVINDDAKQVTVDGREVRLTPIEYKILALLARDKGRVYSIDQIYETIWNMRAIGADNTIAVHIRHIREKIENNPKKPKYLKVVWGTGYKVG